MITKCNHFRLLTKSKETVTDIKIINNINNTIDYNDLSNEELKHELMKKDIEIERLKKLFRERRWYGMKGIHYFLQEEYEVIFNLSTKYSTNALCIQMNVNRSGFYKWLKRRSNSSQREISRTSAFDTFREYHDKYPSHGYRWLNAKIKLDTGTIYSNNYAHKICRFLNIKSDSKHVRSYKKMTLNLTLD